MSSRSIRLPAAAVVLWLSAAVMCRAGYMDWSYTWERDPFAVPSNAGGQNGVASLKLPLLPPGGGPGASPVASMIVVAGTTALGTEQSPADLFQNAQYTVTLTVTDDQTKAVHSFDFHGLLNGSMTKPLVHLSNSFVGGNQESFTISGRLYTVTLGFLAQDAPADAFAGAITASVQVGNPTTASSPEPASLLLAGLALPALGVSAWRRWTRRGASAAIPG